LCKIIGENREHLMTKNNICVVGGCGHVGLPLAILLAKKGFNVNIYDIDETVIEKVNNGSMPFSEEGAEEMLKDVIGKFLFAANDPKIISTSDFVIVVVGTPVDEHLNPSFTLIKTFFKELMPYFKDGQNIILRSTVFPGTTEKINDIFRDNGLKVNITYCPERIAQGKAMKELVELPQIISGFSDEGIEKATKLFQTLTPDMVITSPMEAEVAKLFTNTWRYIQFAIANQFYMMATKYGLDFYKVYDAIKYKYPRAKDFPPAGFAAGPCLFKDAMQLAAFDNNTFFLGHAAMLVNEGLPNFIVQKLKDKYPIKDMTVGVLGMAFKADIDDKRESLSYKLKKILEIEVKKVLCSDAYIKDERFVSPEELISASDIVIVGIPHGKYADLVIRGDKVLVDIWNFYGKGGFPQ
jgi:UDP-N-acetyl-D-mannosaminuronic acid dehydrogenase